MYFYIIVFMKVELKKQSKTEQNKTKPLHILVTQ